VALTCKNMTGSQACSIASARIRHTGPPLATVPGGISWSISPEASVMCPGRLNTLPGDHFGVKHPLIPSDASVVVRRFQSPPRAEAEHRGLALLTAAG
jgi:hypothetical protein